MESDVTTTTMCFNQLAIFVTNHICDWSSEEDIGSFAPNYQHACIHV